MEIDSMKFVFVALTGDEEIKAYSVNSGTGNVELAQTSPAHGPIGSLFLAPSRDLMYGAHVGSTSLSSYRLDPKSGSLQHINTVETGIATPALAITDSAGQYLITGYYTGGGVTVHKIGRDGSIMDLIQRIDTGEKAHAVLIDPADRFVFIPHVCPNNKISQFCFDKNFGRLTPNSPSEIIPADPNTGPRHMCFGPKGDVIYTVNEQGNTVTAHRYDDSNGTLEIFQDISTLPDGYNETSHCAHIEIHPNGKWVYASNRGPNDSIVGYTISEDDSLTRFGNFPVPASPRSFNIDPTGRFCYCTGEVANKMRCFIVDQKSGHLDPLCDDIDVGTSPFWTLVLDF
tara:strand:- start:5076 stop:6104 length:1029 start_codon:yes stop_codon:yes gene_type:complete